MELKGKKQVFDIEAVRKLLPHRYPFLLLDKVIDFTPGPNPDSRAGAKAVAIKNVTINEPFFNGHFPHMAIMPGVLIIEAMAQAGGIACFQSNQEKQQNLIIASVKEAKFRRPVVPGDRLYLTGEVLKDRGRMVVIKCTAHVDGELVAETEVMAQVTNLP